MRTLRTLLLLLALASPLQAQTPQLDSARAELVRLRGFIRAAETQATKTLDILSRAANVPDPDTVVTLPPPPPPPDTTPAPPPPPPPTSTAALNWWCDWRYQTGNSDNAVRGTALGRGAGPISECHNGRTLALPAGLEVVAKSSATCTGWPSAMTNIMRVNTASSAKEALVVADGAAPTMTVGDYWFHRVYFCATVPNGQSLNSHFVHLGQGGLAAGSATCSGGNGCYSARWFWDGGRVGSDGSFTMQFAPMFNMTGVGRGQGGFKWGGDNAARFRTRQLYVLEVRAHRFHADSARFAVRVSDANGTVLADSDDFLCAVGSCATSGYNRDQLGQYAVYVSDWRRFTGYEIGKNTTVGGTSSTAWLEFGGSAIRVSRNADDWIGLYPTGPER